MTIAQEDLLQTHDLEHRFTREEYRVMANAGTFDKKRVELVNGRILDMPPQDESHVSTVSNLILFLAENLKGYQIRCQGPVSPDDYSEPEPDFAIVPAPTVAQHEHPATALLIIEVSNTTLARDRAKAAVYSAAGVKEYWIVNLKARTIEQYTRPQPGNDLGYASRQVITENEAVQCTTLPLPALRVADCLRWVKR